MYCPKCGLVYHGNTHICNCGAENPYKVARRAETKADIAIGIAHEAMDEAKKASAKANDFRKHICLSGGFVVAALAAVFPIYKATEHPIAYWGSIGLAALVATLIVALIGTFLPARGSGGEQ
jgi:hypothetical protein